MSVNGLAKPQLSYVMAQDVEMREEDRLLVATSPYFRVSIPDLSPASRAVMLELAEGPKTEESVDNTILGADGPLALASFYYHLPYLAQHQMLHFQTGDENGSGPLATLVPISPFFKFSRVVVNNRPYRLSRFAYMRRLENGEVCLETPLSHALIRLNRAVATALIHLLASARTPLELAAACPNVDPGAVTGILALLLTGGFAAPTDNDDRIFEDEDETLQQWEFHDLLFHSRSRMGRHNYGVGGNYRFLHKLDPQPPVKEAQWRQVITLPRPDLASVRAADPGLTDVMEARASIRTNDVRPITLQQLAEFLFRTARVKEQYEIEDKGVFTKRPYPSGGASYEMEFYLTVDKCEGLPAGLYWYDPVAHALAFVHGPDEETEGLLIDAYYATARSCRPQILITLAARFQRVSWKYNAMAYATILKNVGVIYATMYLVATAMGLAPCGLGLGNSDRFARTAGTDYLKETSVGEFILGSVAPR